MNTNKAQRLVFNWLLSGKKVQGYDFDDSNFLVTDGIQAFILPRNIIQFNLEHIESCQKISGITEAIALENQMKLTNDLRMDRNRKRYWRRLYGAGRNTFVDTKFLDFYQMPRFFQSKEGAPVVVTEGVRNIPCGIVMPIRSSWDDGHYYGEP